MVLLIKILFQFPATFYIGAYLTIICECAPMPGKLTIAKRRQDAAKRMVSFRSEADENLNNKRHSPGLTSEVIGFSWNKKDDESDDSPAKPNPITKPADSVLKSTPSTDLKPKPIPPPAAAPPNSNPSWNDDDDEPIVQPKPKRRTRPKSRFKRIRHSHRSRSNSLKRFRPNLKRRNHWLAFNNRHHRNHVHHLKSSHSLRKRRPIKRRAANRT